MGSDWGSTVFTMDSCYVPSASPPIIGLTGGIGAGKSAVAGILRDLGCLVSDSDEAARAALRETAIREKIVSWWGENILDQDGEIDRAKVAAIVFGDANERRRLEGLTHPWIERHRKKLFESAPPGVRALVIDAPLLMEAGLDGECQAVIFVEADRSTRLERVNRDRGWDEDKLAMREDSQLPLDEKRKRADYVVSNNTARQDLREQVQSILNQIAPLAGN